MGGVAESVWGGGGQRAYGGGVTESVWEGGGVQRAYGGGGGQIEESLDAVEVDDYSIIILSSYRLTLIVGYTVSQDEGQKLIVLKGTVNRNV